MHDDDPRPADPSGDPPDADTLSRKFQKELNAGLVGLVLLSVLSRADQDLYGYQIAKLLAGGTPERAGPFKQGALYPVLRALAGGGLLVSHVVPSSAGPPRRYYRITAQGRAMLARWSEAWTQTRAFVDHTLHTPPPPGAP